MIVVSEAEQSACARRPQKKSLATKLTRLQVFQLGQAAFPKVLDAFAHSFDQRGFLVDKIGSVIMRLEQVELMLNVVFQSSGCLKIVITQVEDVLVRKRCKCKNKKYIHK